MTARVPRFRALAFLHFLSSVDAVHAPDAEGPDPIEGALEAAPRSSRSDALDLLGLPPSADGEVIKRAFRRLARALHPDLHPRAGDAERRELERRLAKVNAAYGELRLELSS